MLRIRPYYGADLGRLENTVWIPLEEGGLTKLNKDTFNNVAAAGAHAFDYMGEDFGMYCVDVRNS